jgi:predicted MarR family transcription regulator
MAADTPSTKNTDFDREKWQADLRLREREIALREQEHELKRREDQRSKWTSPLVLALFSAALAAFGNAVVAYINGTAQRELEETRAEAVRILEMIKTDDPDKASTNLRFLVKAGLITNESRRIAVTNFVTELKPGSGPVLPSAQEKQLRQMMDSIGASIDQLAASKPKSDDMMKEMMMMMMMMDKDRQKQSQEQR